MSAPHANGSTGRCAPIGCVDLRPDGRRLAGGGPDGAVSIWDTADPAHLVQGAPAAVERCHVLTATGLGTVSPPANLAELKTCPAA